MKIRTADLETVIGPTSAIPQNTLPEYAFIGRSNVGKSTLINSLMNRKSLARVSSEPGKTRTINYYNINGQLYLVDLPGYGYAKVPKGHRQSWDAMVKRYLVRSPSLKRIFLLVDIRHEPGQNDKKVHARMVLLGMRPVIIATKADKIKKSQLQKHISMVRRGLGLNAEDVLIPYSSPAKMGRDEVWALMGSLPNNGSPMEDGCVEHGKRKEKDNQDKGSF